MKSQLIALKKKVQGMVQITKRVTIARNEILTVANVPPQVSEFEGYPVFLHDTYVLACIAIPPEVPGVMFRTDGMIVVNKKFLDCPDYVREASMYHELGHLKLKHKALGFKDKALFNLFSTGEMMKQEYEADLYAVEKGANVLKALEYYSQFDFVDKKSLQKRIIRLKSIKL